MQEIYTKLNLDLLYETILPMNRIGIWTKEIGSLAIWIYYYRKKRER